MNTMTYLIKVSVNPDVLLQTYADGQDIEITDLTENVEDILASELNSWLDSSGVCVISSHKLLEDEQK